MEFKTSKKMAIFILALLGLCASGILFNIYLQANFNPNALASFCTINDLIDCDGVEKSMLAQIFGIPFACWGMIIYLMIMSLLFVDKLKNIKVFKFLEVFKNPQMYIAAIGYIVLILSLILAGTALFMIHKICLMCASTYLIDLAIALVATDFEDGGIVKVFKTSVDDFVDAVKQPVYGVSFGVCALVVAGFLYYSNSSYVFVPHLKTQRDIKVFEKMITNNPYKFKGNIMGDAKPKVTMMLFTDYECPICRLNNVMLNKAVKDVKGIQIQHKNYPLDSKCNKLVKGSFHDNACLYAKYAVAAENQNKWGEMNDLLFSMQPKTEDEILKLAKNLKFDDEQLFADANSDETMNKIKEDINLGIRYKVDGTPTIIVQSLEVPVATLQNKKDMNIKRVAQKTTIPEQKFVGLMGYDQLVTTFKNILNPAPIVDKEFLEGQRKAEAANKKIEAKKHKPGEQLNDLNNKQNEQPNEKPVEQPKK